LFGTKKNILVKKKPNPTSSSNSTWGF